MYDNLIYLSIVLLSSLGFGLSSYIFCRKKYKKPLVCPMNFKCDEVLFSKYSKFFGIPIEALGLFYYAFNIIGYSSIFLWSEFRTPQTILLLFLATTSGFLFSVYLTSIQVFKLKELCSWCLASSLICGAIFILILNSSGLATLSSIFKEDIIYWIFAYSLLLLWGFITVFIYEILSVYFAKDNRVSNEESSVLHILSQIASTVLGGIIIFNYVYYMSGMVEQSYLPQFIFKIIILAVLAISHLIINIYKATQLYLGPLSLISWGFIIILEVRGINNILVLYYLLIYLALVLTTIVFVSKIRP